MKICDGCKNIRTTTTYSYDPENITELCDACSYGLFCHSCGLLIAGTEDIFRTEGTGYCQDCYDDLQAELNDEYQTDEY